MYFIFAHLPVTLCDRYILVLRTPFEQGLFERFDDSNLWCQQHVLCSSEQPQIHHSCDIATCFRWNAVACSSRTSTPRSIFSTTSQDTSSEKWRKSMSNVSHVSNVSNLKSISFCLRLELELGDVVGRARGHACRQIPDRLVMIMIDVRQRKQVPWVNFRWPE